MKEMKSNGFRDVIVLDCEELVVDPNFYAKLFGDFALKGGIEGLSGLHFTTGKFP